VLEAIAINSRRARSATDVLKIASFCGLVGFAGCISALPLQNLKFSNCFEKVAEDFKHQRLFQISSVFFE
jgi:hypothetical protein